MAKKLKAGDNIVFHNTKTNRASLLDLTPGKIYKIEFDGSGEFFVYDDVGAVNYACDPKRGTGKWTKIVG